MTGPELFQQHQPYLQGLAYRMLGSVSDAEDIVQDAYLRWHKIDHGTIDNPQAFLTTVVSRLCLDRLGEARRKRETYIGPWLPDPLVDQVTPSPEEEIARDISFALMLALERLSPLERAAFLLHDVFDVSFAEIASTLERSEAACRQLAKRARQHIQVNKPRFDVSTADSEQLADAFFIAAKQGDVQQLQEILQAEAVLHSDGGGHRLAALRLIYGADKISRFYAGIARKLKGYPPHWSRRLTINGQPGLLTLEADGLLQTITLCIENHCIRDIYVVRNPEKLQHLLPLVPDTCKPLLDRTADYYHPPGSNQH